MILQIAVEFPQLIDKEHPLVHYGAGRHGADIGILRALLKFTPYYVQSSVELNAFLYVSRLSDETLPDGRHALHRPLSENLRAYRHLSPSKERKLCLGDDHFHHPHGKHSLHGISGKKQHTDTVFTFFSQHDLLFCGSRPEESMRDLSQDSDAVTDLSGRILAGAMIQLLNDMESIIQDSVFFCPVYIDDRTDAAGVAFS